MILVNSCLMNEIIGHLIFSLVVFIIVTLGAHFFAALAWLPAMGVALLVIAFIYIGIWYGSD